MDLGEPFKRGFNVKPGEDGTFLVLVDALVDRERNTIDMGPQLGFTTIDDLLIWMAKHGTKSRVAELKEADVLRDKVVGALCGMDAMYGVRRTTAAEVIRERDARNGGGKQALAHPAPTPNDAA